ncbi:MAG: VTT domain-containing protein [Myxococcota bacterium]
MIFREDFLTVGNWFVRSFGALGVFFGFLIPDALTVPIPQDAFMAFALAGGMPFEAVVGAASTGSLVGGSLGWLLGRQLRRTAWYRRVTDRRAIDAEALMHRYGLQALAVAAVTPLPYSVMCWASGALGVPYAQFILVSLLRILRVAVYLWLIQMGLINVLS